MAGESRSSASSSAMPREMFVPPSRGPLVSEMCGVYVLLCTPSDGARPARIGTSAPAPLSYPLPPTEGNDHEVLKKLVWMLERADLVHPDTVAAVLTTMAGLHCIHIAQKSRAADDPLHRVLHAVVNRVQSSGVCEPIAQWYLNTVSAADMFDVFRAVKHCCEEGYAGHVVEFIRRLAVAASGDRDLVDAMMRCPYMTTHDDAKQEGGWRIVETDLTTIKKAEFPDRRVRAVVEGVYHMINCLRILCDAPLSVPEWQNNFLRDGVAGSMHDAGFCASIHAAADFDPSANRRENFAVCCASFVMRELRRFYGCARVVVSAVRAPRGTPSSE